MTVEIRELRTLSQRVRQFRRGSGLNKTALARKAGVATSTISAIEQADLTGYNPHVATLASIAAALDVKVGEIVNRGHLIPL